MPEAKFSFSGLNVGQGSMQVIEEGDDTNIAIDCNISCAPEYVRRYLGRRRVDHLDLFIFSGTDQDHADVEGFQALINKTEGRIGEIWYPDFPADTDNWKAVLRLIEELSGRGTRVRKPQAGDLALQRPPDPGVPRRSGRLGPMRIRTSGAAPWARGHHAPSGRAFGALSPSCG